MLPRHRKKFVKSHINTFGVNARPRRQTYHCPHPLHPTLQLLDLEI
jgi:hypothetical protein